MYMTYAQSNTTTSLQGTAYTSRGMTNKQGYSKRFLRYLIIAAILGTVFSFGAIVQAYAGDGAVSGPAPISSTQSVTKSQSEKIVIQTGDTLWDIASAHKSKSENTSSYVAKLKSVNNLSSSALKEGQVLLLP